jgi:hypothetical protein
MLVGDIVQAIREAITDQPQTFPIPASTISSNGDTGVTLTPGTYYAVLTQWNSWGETLPTAEVGPFTVNATNDILVSSPLLPGATKIRVYLTFANGSAGTESQFVESTTTPFVINANPVNTGQPPTRNTAYNPDMNGDSFSAYTLFNWVNDALSLASQICGGLIDYSGVQTQAGQPMYIIPGKWANIPDVWYDGYPLAPDKAGNFFRRNAITASVLTQVACTLLSDRMMLEVWPQCARTGAATTLSAPLSAVATSASLTNGGGFLLTNGMMQVDSEIMAYNGQFKNLIRGLGGTTAVAHNSGAPVVELNLFFHGWRQFAVNYQPGMALNSIMIPDEWSPIMPIYGLARVKLAEQNISEYQALKKDFESSLTSWFKQNKVVVGPKQVGDVSNNLEVIPSLGGGWIVPSLLFPILYVDLMNQVWQSPNGGAAWLFISTVCSILGTALFGMSVKRSIQRLAVSNTTLHQVFERTSTVVNGCKNFVLSAYEQSSKFLRNALMKIGESEKDTGFLSTVAQEPCSISGRAGNQHILSEVSDISFVNPLGTNFAIQQSNNSEMIEVRNSTVPVCANGGTNFLKKKDRKYWKALNIVGVKD